MVHECRCVAHFILIFMLIRKSTGYNADLSTCPAFSGIDTTLYERRAVMDSANKRQQVWHITLPCLKSVIIMIFHLNVERSSTPTSGLFFQLSQGASGSIFKRQQLSTYVYNAPQIFHSDRNDFCNILPVCALLHHPSFLPMPF